MTERTLNSRANYFMTQARGSLGTVPNKAWQPVYGRSLAYVKKSLSTYPLTSGYTLYIADRDPAGGFRPLCLRVDDPNDPKTSSLWEVVENAETIIDDLGETG